MSGEGVECDDEGVDHYTHTHAQVLQLAQVSS